MPNTTLPASLFGYWRDPNHWVQVCPDPPTPEEAKPFHVVIRSEHVIPFSGLVFARDANHARLRVLHALTEMLTKHYDDKRHPAFHKERMDRIREYARAVEARKKCEYTCTVEPYPIHLLAAEVNWASNGGILP